MIVGKNKEKLAVIETIDENGYTISIYNSENKRYYSEPSNTFFINGSISQDSIILALGDGWEILPIQFD